MYVSFHISFQIIFARFGQRYKVQMDGDGCGWRDGLKIRRVAANTKWFKYDRDYLYVNKSQFVPVIFEPLCILNNQ
jgi:hypothetical protein